jgi:hypothetical protein
MVIARLQRDGTAAFEHELWLWFFAGIVKQRWKDRRRSVPAWKPTASPTV